MVIWGKFTLTLILYCLKRHTFSALRVLQKIKKKKKKKKPAHLGRGKKNNSSKKKEWQMHWNLEALVKYSTLAK